MAQKKLINKTNYDLSVLFEVRLGSKIGGIFETKEFSLPAGEEILASYGNAENPFLSGLSVTGLIAGGIEAHTAYVLEKSSELDDCFNCNDTIIFNCNETDFLLDFTNSLTNASSLTTVADGLLPWDDWFYHLSYRRDEVNKLHKQAVSLQYTIQQQVTLFNSRLKDYQNLVGANGALLIISNIIQMEEQKYKDYRVELDQIEKEVTGSVPMVIVEMFSEMIAGTLLADAIFNLAKLAKSVCCVTEEAELALAEVVSVADAGVEAGVAVASETAAIAGEAVGEEVSEIAAEAVIEGASLSSLAATGIAIFAAVGIDMIFGAIDGAREKKELDKQINSLKEAVNKSKTYYNTICSKMLEIEAGIIKEEKRFLSLIGAVAKVAGQEPTFFYTYKALPAEATNFISAQQHALHQYGLFHEMKEAWLRRLNRHPNQTKEEFLGWFIDDQSGDVTMEALDKCWDILAKNSDTMKLAE